jgi:hypothetical protein
LINAWRLLAVVGLLAALAAACDGGGGEPQTEGSPTASPTGEGSPTASPTGEGSPAASPTEEAAVPAPCRALQDLKTYRYSFNMEIESPEPSETPAETGLTPTATITREFPPGPYLFQYAMEVSYQAPDRFEAVVTTAGASPFSMIFVGDQAWVQLNDVWTQSSSPGVGYEPADLCQAILADLDLSLVEPQEEKINDVKTLHYTFSNAFSEGAMGKIYGDQSDMAFLLKNLDVDLWLAEKDNWPVRLDTSSRGVYADGRELRVHLLLDIKDPNDDDIRIEPPM